MGERGVVEWNMAWQTNRRGWRENRRNSKARCVHGRTSTVACVCVCVCRKTEEIFGCRWRARRRKRSFLHAAKRVKKTFVCLEWLCPTCFFPRRPQSQVFVKREHMREDYGGGERWSAGGGQLERAYGLAERASVLVCTATGIYALPLPYVILTRRIYDAISLQASVQHQCQDALGRSWAPGSVCHRVS